MPTRVLMLVQWAEVLTHQVISPAPQKGFFLGHWQFQSCQIQWMFFCVYQSWTNNNIEHSQPSISYEDFPLYWFLKISSVLDFTMYPWPPLFCLLRSLCSPTFLCFNSLNLTHNSLVALSVSLHERALSWVSTTFWFHLCCLSRITWQKAIKRRKGLF